uniref:Variant surface glycoprotein 1125.472 n=1 Tax=Trypanosoma brucei TaxID=5691 RepID=A0A1J0R5W4_9TRYP|nr:variant surface glycoprotein 1125.472 [Trypanosoma brucei]
MQPALYVLAFLALSAMRTKSQPTGTAGQAVTDRCSEAEYTKLLANSLENELSTAVKNKDQLTDEFKELTLAAAAQSDPRRSLGFSALAALAAARAAAVRTAIQQNEQAILKAAKVLHKRAAQLLQIESTAPATELTGTKTGFARGAGTFGASTERCTIDIKAETAATDTCTNGNTNKPNLQLAAAQLAAETHIKLTKDAMLGRRALTLTADAIGTIATATTQATNDGKCGSTGSPASSAANGVWGFLAFKTTADNDLQTTKIKSDADPAKPCGTAPTHAEVLTVTAEVTRYTICTARQLKIPRQLSVLEATVASLKGDRDMQLIAAALLAEKQATKATEVADEPTEKTLKETYGAEPDAIQKNFIAKLKEGDKTVKIADTTITGSIEVLSKGSKFATALAFFQGQAYRAQRLRTKITVPAAEEKKTGCEKETNKDDCNKKPGCKYNDGENKCEKDSAQAPEGTTNTNATGSNSIVIHKVPILLEFVVLASRLEELLVKIFFLIC